MAAPSKTVALPFAAEVGSPKDVTWPVLEVAIDWVERHCVVPDRFEAGQPYRLASYQLWFYANHYRVREDAELTEVPDNRTDSFGNVVSHGMKLVPTGAPAFYYRRSQIIMPQKAGKGPLTASQICLEAVGPAMFAGWSDGTEVYRCSDHFCDCGWEYEYAEGEAMGAPWPTALIQVTAFSEEQAGNVWDALKPMIELGPLASVINIGEEFARLPGGGRIDKVTSSAKSRLGQRVTFVPQDELGLWVKENKMISVADTQRRGAAGMQGRVVETTNSFDPAEESVAQGTAMAAMKSKDLFRIHPQGDPSLRFADKRQRRLILKHVYAGCHWINLDSIEAEMAEILERDPAQAERFFGNRVVAGLGAWVESEEWAKWSRPDIVVPQGAEVCGGFDGSESDDWTAIRLQTKEGHRFTPLYGPDRRPTYWDPRDWGGSIPRGEVSAAVDEISREYRLRRLYADPRDWETEIGDWALKLGEEVVFEWATYRIIDMHKALVQARTDLIQGRSTHDGDETVAIHVGNARKIAKPMERYIIGKPDQHRKIDICMADVLAHRAASDLRAEGWIVQAAKQKALTRVRGLARSR